MSYIHQKGFSWLPVIVAIGVVVTLGVFIAPRVLFTRGGGERTKALINAKSIVGGLLTFKGDRGAYPCDATRELLEKEGIDFLPPGKSANAYFAQLLATNHIDSEKTFFAPAMPGRKEGDDIRGSSDRLLEAGENCFAYLMAEEGIPLTDVNARTPLVLSHVIPIGNKPLFESGPYGDKCVMALVDGSGLVCEIDQNGNAISPEGENIFQTGPDSLFGNEIPFVTHPLKP